MYYLTLLAEASDSVWRKIISEIPHSPAAILLYIILALCAVIIWRAHRSAQSPDE